MKQARAHHAEVTDLIGDLDAGLQQDVGELRVRFCCHPQSEVRVGLYGVDHLYTESSFSQYSIAALQFALFMLSPLSL